MRKNPTVYIVLPVYNGENYFLEQLMSLYYQTYENWYLIIINDWSTDSSENIAKKFVKDYNLHDKVKIFKKKNWGLNSAITRWFEEIKKLCDIDNIDNLVSYCDCDDIRTREKLAIQVKYMVDNPECWLSYHNMVGIDGNGILIKSSYVWDYYYHKEDFIYVYFLKSLYLTWINV